MRFLNPQVFCKIYLQKCFFASFLFSFNKNASKAVFRSGRKDKSALVLFPNYFLIFFKKNKSDENYPELASFLIAGLARGKIHDLLQEEYARFDSMYLLCAFSR